VFKSALNYEMRTMWPPCWTQ